MKQLLVKVFIIGLIAINYTSYSCSVPVFRYALERWYSGYYEGYIFYKGELDKDLQEHIKQLEKESYANLSFMLINIDNKKNDKRIMEFYNKSIKGKTLPLLTLCYPMNYGSYFDIVWEGKPTKGNIRKIIGSPKRKQIVENISSGDSAVWVVIESGNKAKDDKAVKTLQTVLDSAKKEIELPEGVVAMDSEEIPYDPKDRLRSGIPLKLDFSTITISRDDPAEDIFLEMLLRIEPELIGKLNGTVAIPIIGRARAIYPLMNDEITKDSIMDLCYYITGSCSCEIKAQNPGRDLLFAVPWDDIVNQTIGMDDTLPELGGLSEMPKVLGSTTIDINKNIDNDSDILQSPKKAIVENQSIFIVLIIVIMIMIFGVMITTLVIIRNKNQDNE